MSTTMIITKGATADGSMVVTHSDDNELADQRVIRVPAGDHAPGSRRPVMAESYPHPRMVTSGRGPGYDTPGWPATEPIGEIQQAAHTYAYFDGVHGIVNGPGVLADRSAQQRSAVGSSPSTRPWTGALLLIACRGPRHLHRRRGSRSREPSVPRCIRHSPTITRSHTRCWA